MAQRAHSSVKMTMSPMALHQYWQQRVNKEKKAMASHLGPYYAEKGFRLATPDLHDAEETAQEALQGFYRVRSVPGMARDPEEVVNGHVTLPRPRWISPGSTRASSRSAHALCSHCEKGETSSIGGGSAKLLGADGSRSGGSARLTGSAVVSNAGSRARMPGFKPSSERSIGFYNNQRKVENVTPVRSGSPSSQASSHYGESARLGSSATLNSSKSLQREVEALVRQEMERMVMPLQEQLQKERAGRELAEQKIKMLSKPDD